MQRGGGFTRRGGRFMRRGGGFTPLVATFTHLLVSACEGAQEGGCLHGVEAGAVARLAQHVLPLHV
eukprot:6429685-Pyramimonas_sp.AAC.2